MKNFKWEWILVWVGAFLIGVGVARPRYHAGATSPVLVGITTGIGLAFSWPKETEKMMKNFFRTFGPFGNGDHCHGDCFAIAILLVLE